jgi:hypothetical protein
LSTFFYSDTITRSDFRPRKLALMRTLRRSAKQRRGQEEQEDLGLILFNVARWQFFLVVVILHVIAQQLYHYYMNVCRRFVLIVASYKFYYSSSPLVCCFCMMKI